MWTEDKMKAVCRRRTRSPQSSCFPLEREVRQDSTLPRGKLWFLAVVKAPVWAPLFPKCEPHAQALRTNVGHRSLGQASGEECGPCLCLRKAGILESSAQTWKEQRPLCIPESIWSMRHPGGLNETTPDVSSCVRRMGDLASEGFTLSLLPKVRPQGLPSGVPAASWSRGRMPPPLFSDTLLSLCMGPKNGDWKAWSKSQEAWLVILPLPVMNYKTMSPSVSYPFPKRNTQETAILPSYFTGLTWGLHGILWKGRRVSLKSRNERDTSEQNADLWTVPSDHEPVPQFTGERSICCSALKTWAGLLRSHHHGVLCR